jgi:hypothetical protein
LLREGLTEMFTVARLGIGGRLAKTFTTSNPGRIAHCGPACQVGVRE